MSQISNNDIINQDEVLITREAHYNLMKQNTELQLRLITLQEKLIHQLEKSTQVGTPNKNNRHCECCLFNIRIRNDNNQVNPEGDADIDPAEKRQLIRDALSSPVDIEDQQFDQLQQDRDYEEEKHLSRKENLVSMQERILQQEGFVEQDEGHRKRMAMRMYNNTYLVSKIFVHLHFATKDKSFRFMSQSLEERNKTALELERSMIKYNASLVTKEPQARELLKAMPLHLCNKNWGAKGLLVELLKTKGGKGSSANPKKRKTNDEENNSHDRANETAAETMTISLSNYL